MNLVSSAFKASRSSASDSPIATSCLFVSNLSFCISKAFAVISNSASFAVCKADILSSKLLVSSSASNLAFAIILFASALSIFNCLSESAICWNFLSNSIASFNSLAISSPIPTIAPLTSLTAPEKSPEKTLTIAPPIALILSVKTLRAAPIAANATSNNSAPFLVLVKKTIKEPIRTTKAPIPVEISPAFIVPNIPLAVTAAEANPAFTPFKETPITLNSPAAREASLDTSPILDFTSASITIFSAIILFFKVQLLF